jgi:hypothetical protein
MILVCWFLMILEQSLDSILELSPGCCRVQNRGLWKFQHGIHTPNWVVPRSNDGSKKAINRGIQAYMMCLAACMMSSQFFHFSYRYDIDQGANMPLLPSRSESFCGMRCLCWNSDFPCLGVWYR